MRNTDVSRESIRVKWNQRTSIRYKLHLESTMFPFRHAENLVRGYDSSRGPEVKASSGRPAAACPLLKSRSVSLVIYVDIGYKNRPTLCLVQFTHDFLHSFYHPVRYSIGLLPLLVIMKHT